MDELRLSHLRPAEIQQRLTACPAIYVPLGPLEWHGPHLPLGTDPLNAENVALGVCRRIGGIVWPTQFWGTERERPPALLRALGFEENQYVVGMDFPRNSLPSAYCAAERWRNKPLRNWRTRSLGCLTRIIHRRGAESAEKTRRDMKLAPLFSLENKGQVAQLTLIISAVFSASFAPRR